MGTKKEVIIVGGGIIGLACAHYLLESGTSVRIIEKNYIGDGASHGNCGLLYYSDIKPLCSPGTVSHEIMRSLRGTSPLYIKPGLDIKLWGWLLKFASKCNSADMEQSAKAKYELLQYSANLYKTVLGLSGMSCDFEDKGILTVFRDREKFENYQKTSAFLSSYGLTSQKIEKAELLEMEPALREDVSGAWFNKADYHLRPDMLLTSWRNYLTRKGLLVEEECSVLEFMTEGKRVTGVVTDKGEFSADAFVLATGAWAPQTLKQLNVELPVQAGKGYSITMERPGLCPSHPCVLYEKSMVATPWKSGYRLGGTMEFSGFSDSLNPKRLSKLISGATAYLREPLGAPLLEEWAGLRPMTYDDMPIIDRAPSRENLIIATGHGMLGLTLAPGTGKVVCDLVQGKTPEINIAPFGIKRFK